MGVLVGSRFDDQVPLDDDRDKAVRDKTQLFIISHQSSAAANRIIFLNIQQDNKNNVMFTAGARIFLLYVLLFLNKTRIYFQSTTNFASY